MLERLFTIKHINIFYSYRVDEKINMSSKEFNTKYDFNHKKKSLSKYFCSISKYFLRAQVEHPSSGTGHKPEPICQAP